MSERTLADFKADVAARFVKRSDMDPGDAAEYAAITVAAYLEDEKIEFGDPEYGWSKDEADEIADTDMSYWEAA